MKCLRSAVVGADIIRPPNILFAKYSDSRRESQWIALRRCDFVSKITGRIISAPTVANGKQLDKLEFEDVTILSVPVDDICRTLHELSAGTARLDKLEFEE